MSDTYVPMTIDEALTVCTEWGADYGLSGMLETLQAMQAQYERDELYPRDRTAYRVAMASFRRLLAPAGE